MAFSICCLGLSGVALAADLESDVPADLISDVPADMESDVFADVYSAEDSVSTFALEDAGNAQVYLVSGSVKYGISGSNCTSWTGGFTASGGSSDGALRLGSFAVNPPTTGGYMLVGSQTRIRIEWPVNSSYPDDEGLDLWGSTNGRLYVIANNGAGRVGMVYPNTVNLLVNGESVGEYTPRSDFKYSSANGIGDSVTSVGFEYYFDQEYFNLLATDKNVSNVLLFFTPGTMNTNSNTSQQGFFASLFNWLANIRDNLESGLSGVVSAVTSLPSKIADAVKGLFVPSDTQMDELKASFNALLSEKLGFVYQAGSLVTGVFDAVFDAVDNPNSDVSFTVPAFPAFNVEGTDVSLWDDSIVVDIADNQVVQTVQQVASPFVIAVMVWGFVHSMEDAFMAFVGGKSLSDWVRDRKGEKE